MKMQQQSGMFLLEALIAILIFSLGVLGMVAMGSTAIAAQSDAQYRTEATNFASDMAGKIAVSIADPQVTGIPVQTAIQAFAHQPIVTDGWCSFAGATSTAQVVSDWVDRVTGVVAGTPGLPGTTNARQSIQINTSQPGYSLVTVTVCWKTPSSSATPLANPWHRQVVTTYVTNQI